MSRQEFIEKLRMTLSGRLPSAAVADNVNYYEDYINMEIRKGRTEEEVLAALGDPRLIAKTIIQTNAGAGASMPQSTGYQSAGAESGSAYGGTNSSYGSESAYGGAGSAYGSGNVYGNTDNVYGRGDDLPRIFRIPGWLVTLLVIIITLFLICIVFSVLSFLVPLIIAMAAVMLIVKIFRDWLN